MKDVATEIDSKKKNIVNIFQSVSNLLNKGQKEGDNLADILKNQAARLSSIFKYTI